jgi:hypothetical protein
MCLLDDIGLAQHSTRRRGHCALHKIARRLQFANRKNDTELTRLLSENEALVTRPLMSGNPKLSEGKSSRNFFGVALETDSGFSNSIVAACERCRAPALGPAD